MSIFDTIGSQIKKVSGSELAKSLKVTSTVKGAVEAAKSAATGKIAQSVTESKVVQEQAQRAIEEGAAKSAGEWFYKNKSSVLLGGIAVVLFSVAGFLKYYKYSGRK